MCRTKPNWGEFKGKADREIGVLLGITLHGTGESMDRANAMVHRDEKESDQLQRRLSMHTCMGHLQDNQPKSLEKQYMF